MSFQDTSKFKAGFADDAPEESAVTGECDCCGKQRVLSRNWLLGYIETFACDECRGA